MSRGAAIALIDRLHDAQNEFYAGAQARPSSRSFSGVEHRWSTVGLYEIADQQIAACWLLPLDQRAFDLVWGGASS